MIMGVKSTYEYGLFLGKDQGRKEGKSIMTGPFVQLVFLLPHGLPNVVRHPTGT
jgi:hypothetical protein